MAVNCDAPFILTQAIGRGMVERGHGKVVFITSILSYQGGINVPGYTASKGAVTQLIKAFANEWASSSLNVNGVAPGYVATENTAALQDDPARRRALMDRTPAARWAEPAEIAEPIAFFCCDLARFIHGTILPVDGGWLGRQLSTKIAARTSSNHQFTRKNIRILSLLTGNSSVVVCT